VTTIFELMGKMSIDGLDKTKQELSGLEKNTQNVQKGMKVMGAAFTAVGAAGLAMIQSTKKINAGLSVTALTLGITTKEMRDLTLATTNVTFPISEVAASFDLLARAGIKDIEVLQATATAFDTLGDALGMSASQVTDVMVPAMKTFRLSAKEIADKTDIMTYMVRNSTISLDDFNTMVGYTSQEMVDAGLTIDDLAAAMMYMSDNGVEPGKVMLREWNKAVTQAEKEGIALTQALGMTSAELETYKGKLEGATGMTQEYADVANEQYTIMDKLKQKWSEVTLSMSGFLEPLEPVLAGMTAMGPLLFGLSMVSIPRLISALVVLKGAFLALAPVAAMAAVIGGLVYLGVTSGRTEADVKDLTVVLDKAKAKLNDLEEANRGTGEEADALRIKIALLNDVLKEHNVVVEDATIYEGDWQERFKERSKLLDKIKREQDLLGRTIEYWGKEETGWANIRKKQLGEYYVELEKIEGPLVKQVQNTKDLTEAYRNATPEQIRYLDAIVMQAYELEQAAKTEKYRLSVLEDAAREEVRLVEDTRDARIRAFDAVADKAREAHRERLQQIEDEYRLSLSDIERGIQDQIDAIDSLTETEDDAERERLDHKRVAELQTAIFAEEDADKRAALEEQLTEQLARIERRHLLDSRNAQKEALRDELQSVRDGTDIRAIELTTQRNNKITAAELERADQIENFRIEKENLDEHYAELLEKANQQVTSINEAYDGLKTSYEIEITTYHKDVFGGDSGGSAGGGINIPEISLPGFAKGGIIPEPTLLYGLKSQRPYGIAGESGKEYITPGLSGLTINIIEPHVRNDRDIDIMGERIVARLRQKGVKV